jgi:uncharacterized protein with FMN-binding domain
MTRGKRSNKKVANGLVALSSAAVLGVYAAGFVRTRAAAQRFAEADQRRLPVHAPAPVAAPSPAAPNQPAVPVSTAPAPSVEPIERPVTSSGRPAESRTARRRPAAARAPVAQTARAEVPAIVSTTRAEGDVPSPAAPAQATVNDPPAAAAPPAAVPAPVPAPQPAPPPAPAPPAPPHYKDGTYTGWGTSRHGDIQASVVIEGGRIASASISQCFTRYPCSWIAALPPQVAQRQSPEVDYVSGATQSTNAFYYAVVEALSKAK